MKFIIFLSLLFSFSCFAETSCLKIDPPNSKVLLMCDVSSKGGSFFFGYQNLKSCFQGSASEMVSKINDIIFCDFDECLRDAVVINEDVISLIYVDPFNSIEHTVKRCE